MSMGKSNRVSTGRSYDVVLSADVGGGRASKSDLFVAMATAAHDRSPATQFPIPPMGLQTRKRRSPSAAAAAGCAASRRSSAFVRANARTASSGHGSSRLHHPLARHAAASRGGAAGSCPPAHVAGAAAGGARARGPPAPARTTNGAGCDPAHRTSSSAQYTPACSAAARRGIRQCTQKRML